MSLTPHLETLLADEGPTPREMGQRRPQIFEMLRRQPDGGAEAAVACLLGTDDRVLASYVGQYLSRVPGERDAKIRAAEGLRGSPLKCGIAAGLVRWLPPELLDGFVRDYLALPDPAALREGSLEAPWADLESVVFVIAEQHPERVRPFADRISDEYTLEQLALGTQDAEIDALMARWRADGDVEHLETVAKARTEHAQRQLLGLRDDFAHSEDEDSDGYAHANTYGEDEDEDDEPAGVWERLVLRSGLLPDTGRAAGYGHAHHGYVVARNASPHRLGGVPSGDAPLCQECEAPAAPLLRLSAEQLPGTGLTEDPEFFWYTCPCGEAEDLFVRCDGETRTAYAHRTGSADPAAPVLPEELALTLEQAPGLREGSVAQLGFAQHQVGGLPGWLDEPEHPHCPECETLMPYLATVSGGLTPYGDMPFRGNVYCFWCDTCRVTATLLQESDW